LTKDLGRPLLRAYGFTRDGSAEESAQRPAFPNRWGQKSSPANRSSPSNACARNGAEIGGLKVAARSGWFAVRPSGTEDLCKIYAESLRSEDHLKSIQDEALRIAQSVFAAGA